MLLEAGESLPAGMSFDVHVRRAPHLPDAAKIRCLAVPQSGRDERRGPPGGLRDGLGGRNREHAAHHDAAEDDAERAHATRSLHPPLLAAVLVGEVLQAPLALETAVPRDLLLRRHPLERESHLDRLDEHGRVGDGCFVQDRVAIEQPEPLEDVFVLVDEIPAMSSQVRPLKLLTSTTSVSPSQRPRESPSQAQ